MAEFGMEINSNDSSFMGIKSRKVWAMFYII